MSYDIQPLGANEPYIQPARDRFEGDDCIGGVRGLVYATHVGTLYLEESDDDGATWSQTATVAVPAKTTTPLPWTALTKQQYRFRYVNGATAQTKFRLVQQTRGMGLGDVKVTGDDGQQVKVTNGKLDVNAQVTVGAVTAGETIVTAPVTRVVTLTDTPVALTSKANLRQITIRNIDTALRCRLGETGMTAANGKGIALEPQAAYQESFDPTIPVTIYGRSEGASMQVEVYEA